MQIKKVLDVIKTDTYRVRKAEWFFGTAIVVFFTLKQKKKKKDDVEESQWNSAFLFIFFTSTEQDPLITNNELSVNRKIISNQHSIGFLYRVCIIIIKR
jgi:hypothetical protein